MNTKRFLFYGLLGWFAEITFTGLTSLTQGDLRLLGFTNLWMFLIYGLAVYLEPIHHQIAHWRWPIRGLVWLLMIWGIEYVSGFILYQFLGVYPWHYSDPLAIHGLITLRFAPVWFVAGLMFERVHLALDRFRIVETVKP